jgi:hypothetical protein
MVTRPEAEGEAHSGGGAYYPRRVWRRRGIIHVLGFPEK